MSKLIDPQNKILRYPEILSAIKAGRTVWPVNVEMDLSNRCNLRCNWCDFSYIHDGAVLGFELATKILRQLFVLGTKAITFSGGGEPTTNPQFDDIVDYAYGKFKLGLYTNGVQPPLNVRHCFEWIYISLDEISREAYYKSKGVDAFYQVLSTIQNLVLRNYDKVIGVGFLIHQDNYKELPKMIRLLDTKINYIQLRPIVGLSDYSWVPEFLAEVGLVEDDRVYVAKTRFEDLYKSQGRQYGLCRATLLVPCIGADGELWVCPNMRGKLSLGNLKENRFEDLWKAHKPIPVTDDCRVACRNHNLNITLDYICSTNSHQEFI